MAKSTSQAATPNRNTAADSNEIFELFVAELQSRRERLRYLLQLVTLEADRQARSSAPRTVRPRCKASSRVA